LLKQGEAMSPDGLITYLKSAGYIEKNQQADETRSRYTKENNSITIEAGETSVIDGKKTFPTVKVQFAKDGKSVVSIKDLDANLDVKATTLEPKLLSSIVAEGDGRRKAVTIQDIPPYLVKAIVNTEDRDFFNHYGINVRGIARALWRRVDVENDNSPIARQGGSSITSQLVKNLLLSSEKSLERKAKEAYMSVILETRLNKEEIFTLYANQIYLGQQNGVAIYGVGQAANAYFGKDVSQLNLAECAMIAGIIRSPNRYSPYKNLEKTKERRNQVLDSMVETAILTPQEASDEKNTEIKLVQQAQRPEMLDMPYFSQYAEEELPKIIADPEAMQHLRVFTTIDVDLQRLAYNAVLKRLEKIERYFPKKKDNLNAALVAIKPKTGEIVAMIGGKNFLDNQFNRATSAQRQPGSVFKPFVYATAINTVYDPSARVLTTATIFKDEPKTFNFNQETYSPNNYGDFFSNKDVTLRDALVKSKNTITVDLGMQLNIGKVMNLATKAGFPKVEKAYPSMALGTAEATPLQVATAYSIFANLGEKVSPMAINRVTTGEGKTVVAPVAEKKSVIRPDVAYIVDDMLKDVINRGTAVDAHAWGITNSNGRAFAGKTGTSRDGWFAGFTPNLICVVYVGFDDGSDLGMKGADSALPIWADFMQDALALHPEWNGDWQMPDGIRKAEIDIRNGKLIRELTDNEAENLKAQRDFKEQIDKENPQVASTPDPTVDKLFVSDIPAEFRRIELFLSGTVPNKELAVEPTPEDYKYDDIEPTKPKETPTPKPDNPMERPIDKVATEEKKPDEKPEFEPTVTIMICPLSGARATSNCPKMVQQKFKQGQEPKDFCQFHNKK
jgi:penicillin-binding protein 1B